LATVWHQGATRAARVEGDEVVLLDAPDVGALLEREAAGAGAPAELGVTLAASDARFAPPVTRPSKIVCVGMNYRAHIAETGAPVPEFPTLFSKYADALVGATDAIVLPPESDQVDWEVELVAVIGREARRATREQAAEAIWGFTVGNDISMRDWQMRTTEFLQGKTWEASTPVGPAVVSADELGGPVPDLELSCTVAGAVKQRSRTSDLLYDPLDIVAYVSTIVRLRPGDILFTGTPSGTGLGEEPNGRLSAGQTVVCAIEGIGELVNECVDESA
jgi:acylpyruvate hydrolase